MTEPTAADRALADGLYLKCRGLASRRELATEYIAAALAYERFKARAPFLALADEMESDGKGDSGFMEYHEGFNAALVNAAKSIRHAAQDQT